MSKECIHIMVGVAGAGKSTVVEELGAKLVEAGNEVLIICPDDLREQFCNGDRSDQSKNGLVWKTAYAQVQVAMEENQEIIFDATMINPRKRKDLLKMALRNKYKVMGHVVRRDLDVIKEQNKNRKWVVPEHIIENMFKSFVVPSSEEGFHGVVYH